MFNLSQNMGVSILRDLLNLITGPVYIIHILVEIYLNIIQSQQMQSQQIITCSPSTNNSNIISSPLITDPDNHSEHVSFESFTNLFNDLIDMIIDKNHSELTVVIDAFAFEQLRYVVHSKNIQGECILGLIDLLKHYLAYTILRVSGKGQNSDIYQNPLKFGQVYGKQMQNIIESMQYGEQEMWIDLDIFSIQNLIQTLTVNKQQYRLAQKLTKLNTIQFLNQLKQYNKVIEYVTLSNSQKPHTDEQILAYQYNNIAYAHYNLNQFIQALNYYKMSIDLVAKLQGEYCLQSISSLLNIATIYQNIGLLQDSLRWYNIILDIKNTANPEPDVQYAYILFCMGSASLKTQQLQKSMAYCQKALTIIQQIKGIQSIDCIPALNVMSSVFYKTKNYQQSLRYASRSLEIILDYLGPQSMEFITLLTNIGSIFYQMNKIQEALTFFGRSLSSVEKRYGKDCQQYNFLLQSITQIHNSIRGQEGKDVNQGLGEVLQNIAIFLSNSGNLKQSLSYFGLWLSEKNEKNKQQGKVVSNSINNSLKYQIKLINLRCWDSKQPIIFVLLAVMYRKLGKYTQAIEFYKRSLAAHEQAKKMNIDSSEKAITQSRIQEQLQTSKQTMNTKDSKQSFHSNKQQGGQNKQVCNIGCQKSMCKSYFSEELAMLTIK